MNRWVKQLVGEWGRDEVSEYASEWISVCVWVNESEMKSVSVWVSEWDRDEVSKCVNEWLRWSEEVSEEMFNTHIRELVHYSKRGKNNWVPTCDPYINPSYRNKIWKDRVLSQRLFVLTYNTIPYKACV